MKNMNNAVKNMLDKLTPASREYLIGLVNDWFTEKTEMMKAEDSSDREIHDTFRHDAWIALVACLYVLSSQGVITSEERVGFKNYIKSMDNQIKEVK